MREHEKIALFEAKMHAPNIGQGEKGNLFRKQTVIKGFPKGLEEKKKSQGKK